MVVVNLILEFFCRLCGDRKTPFFCRYSEALFGGEFYQRLLCGRSCLNVEYFVSVAECDSFLSVYITNSFHFDVELLSLCCKHRLTDCRKNEKSRDPHRQRCDESGVLRG